MTRGTSRLFGISGLLVVALLSAVQSATAASRPTAVAPTTVEVSGQTQRLSEPTQIPDGLAKSDWQSIRAVYEAGRHAFHPTATGWWAENPGQQWLTTFDQRGFLAKPQTGDWHWGLELHSYGFGDQQIVISGSSTVQAEGQRLSYHWDATVQEWFVNDPRGLEHGFTVRQRPVVSPHSTIRTPTSPLP